MKYIKSIQKPLNNLGGNIRIESIRTNGKGYWLKPPVTKIGFNRKYRWMVLISMPLIETDVCGAKNRSDHTTQPK